MLIISFLKSIKQSINHSPIHPLSHSFYILNYKFYITKALQTMRTTMSLLALILQLLLFATSCKQSTEPKLEAELKLELEDASCTEAWIKLTTTNLQLPTSVTLKQDGVVRKTINVQTQDTLLYIDS
ncbi:MAG: hypothetical protein N3D80_00325, partial [Ignavibacterium album]|nr:hypothetical protein [Ignavibacterium album]